jgi:hypothetical protein
MVAPTPPFTHLPNQWQQITGHGETGGGGDGAAGVLAPEPPPQVLTTHTLEPPLPALLWGVGLCKHIS